MLKTISFVVEIIGTVAFAISGAIVGIEKKMDILGVTILGITTAVGGGIIRDLVLGNTPPQAFVNPIYLIVAAVVSLLSFIPIIRKMFNHYPHLFNLILLIMDSLGLSIFTVLGIKVAQEVYSSIFLLVFVGVVTGVGGGVMRDVMSESTPFIFKKFFYCSACIIGAVITSVLWRFIDGRIAMASGALAIFVLRILAARFHWKLPRA